MSHSLRIYSSVTASGSSLCDCMSPFIANLTTRRRTMKASVKDELTIPKQTRFLVPIELGKVERHVSPPGPYEFHLFLKTAS